MRIKIAIIFTILLIILLGVWGYNVWYRADSQANQSEFYEVSNALGASDTAGFKKALGIRKFHFPKDNGPHPDYKNEWWYYTGNLVTKGGRHFGYQFTLFRIGLKPGNANSPSDWETHQFYMAHLALTDVANQKFYAYQRFSRSALGLAGAKASPFHIWLDNWQVKGDSSRNPQMHLMAKENGISLNLHLTSEKQPVLEGDQGLSQKGSEPGNASYYYSLTRLKTNGSIQVKGESMAVSGLSWMDREWGTTMLEKDQSGWDWFSLQLNNGWDLMYYQLRKTNGQADTTSSGKLIRPDGSVISVPYGSVTLKVENHWVSPSTKTKYPSEWDLSLPSQNIHLRIKPYIPNQELRLSVKYWEGAVKIDGTMKGENVSGSGYVELTGYGNKRTGSLR